jgi:predicted ArsR family transcriptional regulator
MTSVVRETSQETILAALRRERDGLDTNALAQIVGLHPNTVRWHVGVLTDAGLIQSQPEQRHDRGRPSVVHRLTPDGVAHDRDEYRLLATMLTGALAGDSDGEARSYETGVRWGRYLMAVPSPSVRLTPQEATEGVAQLLDEQGFAAEAGDGTICMRRCPFYGLAETNPEVICTLHHGIVDGALAQTGTGVEVERLDPFVEPTLCVAHLRKA